MTYKSMIAKLSPRHFIIALCFLLVFVVYAVIWMSPAAGHDWRDSFAPAGRMWWDPYQVPFHNPPWVALFLWPVAMLPLRMGFIANGLLAIGIVVWLVLREGGSSLAVLVTLLSPPFIGTLLVGNIEWIPIAGILIGGAWGVPLLLAKPQTAGLVAILFFKRSGFKWRFWLPMVAVMLASLLIWGWWPAKIPPMPTDYSSWNLSIFPWGVPLGILCAWLAWKRDGLHWVLLAGILLSPYFGIGSLTPAVALWSVRYPRGIGLAVTVFWLLLGYFVISWNLPGPLP
jgi:hypothetical protein